ncbi:glycosyl transferase [Polymorphobacter fuscus]|uniref:Glycosyl transferase n=2 Tax=Sandarakinorhabdus fusca TaxID=1439888 RepID=A0A7C9KN67_9SPHN|nr:glycosyl transferase [Polymorphobacter fuscus]MQT18343.1 glycosyl transferase [Polymorphobacter fuscus]
MGWKPAQGPSSWYGEEPIREEMFGVERLEDHARSLARAQVVASGTVRGVSLKERLADNEHVLRQAYRTTVAAAEADSAITPAAEWLIDNFHLVERHIREINTNLPPSFYKQLPKLVTGPFNGCPRVFGIAWAYVAHTDSRFDPEVLKRFIRAYQTIEPLTIGELWAVAITLRIVLIENLRRFALRIERSQGERRAADAMADRLLGTETGSPEPAAQVLAALRDPGNRAAGRAVTDSFAVQFVHRLQDQNEGVAAALAWLDERMAERGTNMQAAILSEQERQIGATVTVRNIITSMRVISEIDWSELFERMSPIDDLLARHEGYAAMDFTSRNHYRTAVEDLARSSPLSESEVARRAMQAAVRAANPDGSLDRRRADPGFHLIGDGRAALERDIGYRPPVRQWVPRVGKTLGLRGYGGVILLLGALMLAVPILGVLPYGPGIAIVILLALLGSIPALDAAVALVNSGVTRSLSATVLPALELRGGVPPELRTLVAVPVMLTSAAGVAEHIETLEIHHLASLEGEVYFALLSDWADAPNETMPDDMALLATAEAGIAMLNARYPAPSGGDRFFLFHRHRRWSESEQRWMGWERKRGKLHALNRRLRGATDTDFVTAHGQPVVAPEGVAFVITLDSDTRLPRDTVRRLIGKLGHPLNAPHFDEAKGRVVEGYGILQPRITPALAIGRDGSMFQRLFAGHSGIDPYGAAVSDVYQDLFGEGSYAGKGIYAVDAFEGALQGRVPESSLLSHDLFEGVFARAGLASDVEVVEDFPVRYDVASRRNHRWARGDWQLLPWILGFGDGPKAAVPLVGRAKMVDNLRRSLTAPACVLSLIIAWALPAPAALLWTAFILFMLAVPALIPLIESLFHMPPGASGASKLRALGADARLALARWALVVTFLADQAWVMTDAIVRTLVRLTITRRNLLQWVPAAQLAAGLELSTVAFYRRMPGATVLSLAGFAVALVAGNGGWPPALLIGLLWLASPAVACRISAPPETSARLTIDAAEVATLRGIARQTWRYFEFVVTPTDSMLPPDNYQEDPAAIAHRTSPTNFGLYLLSVASARDFGWIGTMDAIDRLDITMAVMGRLERYRGHFYNWYDTRDCRVLDPHYVSSVDSGNLAGHLIALANACDEWRAAAPAPAVRRAGIIDALALARRASTKAPRATIDAAFADIEAQLAREIDWDVLAVTAAKAEATVFAATTDTDDADLRFWMTAISATIESHRRDLAPECDVVAASDRLSALSAAARTMALAMDFAFMMHPERKLISIGYSVSQGVLDENYYDLLASEARLASFFAIAKGDLPARHWFRLGHAVTEVTAGPVLLSWSGSMFEYLMPALVMAPPEGSLIERTECRVVSRHMEYGRQRGVPWGISESAFNARDLESTYQYSNFGVPGLGLKRGLGDDLVVAPYATALAAMMQPHAAIANFARLEAIGARGRFGFYDALDYTPSRLPLGEEVAIVRNFMAHHQGMAIVALANTVLGGPMRRRFHAEPMVKAADLLLQERMPQLVEGAFAPPTEEPKPQLRVRGVERPAGRRFTSAATPTPATHLLSNGRYTVMLTAAGSGYSRWRDMTVSRWREDPTSDGWGSWLFLRDVGSGDAWSAGFQPTRCEPDSYEVTFNEDRADYVRHDGDLVTAMTVLVSAEDDSEVRRVSVTNNGTATRVIEVTSCAELSLAPQSADVAHPTFSKLFIETEHVADSGALLAHRRKREPHEPDVWAAHLAVADAHAVGSPEFETDRAQFMGRGYGARNPRAIVDGRSLTGSVGAVLDPAFVLRTRLRIPPGETAHVSFWTMAGSSRQAVIDMIDKHNAPTAFDRAATLAFTQAQIQLHHLRLGAGEAAQFQRLAGRMLYASAGMRPPAETVAQGLGPQPGLWSLGISGDLPIIVLRIADIEQVNVAREIVQATDYWRMKQLPFDLVIINERGTSYIQDLQSALEGLVRASQSRAQFGERSPGTVFVLRADLIPDETKALLLAVARVVIDAHKGRLSDQLDARREAVLPPRPPQRAVPVPLGRQAQVPPPDLEYFNGVGGFADNGREYVIVQGPGQVTPLPWINVIANDGFGFQVSADGAGFTWAENSREHPLTPWSNDAVQDPSGQAFYIRDDDDGALFSPTAAPIRDPAGTYVTSHGWGYSRFEHAAAGLDFDLVEYVPIADPVKISRLTIRNRSGRTRRLTVAAYVDWVLGPSRAAAAPFTVTSIDPETGAMFAANHWYPAFAGRTAVFDMVGRQTSWTGDRQEFIGRNGGLDDPEALATRAPFSNRVGAALDPCGAMQTQVELADGASIEIVCLLGETVGEDAARALVSQYRDTDLDAVLTEVRDDWEAVLGTVQVRTPDRSLDIMLNGWLLYQTLACRIRARAGFYQASGAYGFRDQLQDVMALMPVRPAIARAQLVRAAGRQFVEGDVQHWWLPQAGNGVRTRFADDRVWLALVTAHYVATTGDGAVLEDDIGFLDGPLLKPGEMENFFQPTAAAETASLYEHCARALDASLKVGAHGVPLIGGGDWNDGMNRVGHLGTGESVWMGWFLDASLKAFLPIAQARGDGARVAAWTAHRTALQTALDAQAWDGDWYRRGWFDDGSPLGSAANAECRIDSIAQSWSVISGGGDPARARRAMASASRDLVLPETGLALLFTPPFDHSPHDPGYIKGYPPGIRENGGQYTHAALWSVIALAMLGEGTQAGALLAMLNPVNHSRTPSEMHRYKVEPYVVAADISSRLPNIGRGGWTWYTGAAGWMQRAGVEYLLGIRRMGTMIEIDPCIPDHWPGFDVTLRAGGAVHVIHVENPAGVSRGIASAVHDGVAMTPRPLRIPVGGVGETHRTNIVLGHDVR